MPLSLVVAFGLGLAFSAAFIPLARVLGWMDAPSERKDHGAPTPLVGGPAVFLALFLTLAWLGLDDAWLLLACGLVLLSGLVDDRWPLHPWLRFGAQIAACAIMIYGAGIQLDDFGRLFWDRVLGLGPLAVPITVFAALGVINAFNMIDGLDGLAGSVFIICCLAMAILAQAAGQAEIGVYLLIAAAAAAGFLALNARLPWNSRARIFLGDSGSVFLGFYLAWFFIDLGNGPDAAFAPMTAVWIIGIPLIDTTRLMARRWRQGRSAFDADQHHLHHGLLRAGLSVGQTWAVITALCAAAAAVGVMTELAGVPDYWRFWSFIGVALLYLWVVRRLIPPVDRRG